MEENNENNEVSPPLVYNNIDIETGLKVSGSCGRFQIIIQILLMYFVLTIGYQGLFAYFIMDDPSWKCVSNSTDFCIKHYGQTFKADDVDSYSKRCKLKREEWTYTTIKMHSTVTEFDLVCEKSSGKAISSAAFYIGGLLGAFISGPLADKYGRKKIMIISLLVNISASIACGYIMNIWELAILRAIVGSAFVSCYNASVVYLMEYVAPRHRAISGILYNGSYCLSSLYIDGLAYLNSNWRRLQVYACLPCIFVFVCAFFLPESARWLLAVNKNEKAERNLHTVAKYNGKEIAPITLRMQTTANGEGKGYTYLDLLRNWKVLSATLAQAVIWMTTALVYYTIVLDTSKLGGNMYTIFAYSSVAEFPSNFLSLWLCNFLGRKKTILGSLTLAGICAGSIAIIPRTMHATSVLKIGLAILGRCLTNIAYGSVYVWTFEIFPTVVRSQGLAVCTIFERVGGLIAPFLVSVLQDISYILPFITMFVLAVLACLYGLTLPETNKMPTREYYEDFFEKVVPEDMKEMGINNDTADMEV